MKDNIKNLQNLTKEYTNIQNTLKTRLKIEYFGIGIFILFAIILFFLEGIFTGLAYLVVAMCYYGFILRTKTEMNLYRRIDGLTKFNIELVKTLNRIINLKKKKKSH